MYIPYSLVDLGHKLRKEHDAKLHEQADTRKAQIEAAIKEQQAHNVRGRDIHRRSRNDSDQQEAREAKIAELRHSGCPHSATSGPMGPTTGFSPTSGVGSSGPGSVGGGSAPCAGGEYSGMATGGMTYPPQIGGTYSGEPTVCHSHPSTGETKARVGVVDQTGSASGLTAGEPMASRQSTCSRKTNNGSGTQSMPGDYAAR